MKIFHRYSNVPDLTPIRGDFINELNILKAIKTFAQVTNNPKEKCDLYYVRHNSSLFKSLPHPKVYFASPYDQDSFNRADAIATFSSEWTRRLKEGIPYTAGCNIKINKPIITLQQVIDDSLFMPMQGHLKTKKIRRMFGNGFIIGHFGKMRPTNFPHTFLKILPELKKKYPHINVIFSDKTGVESSLIKQFSFSYNDMPYALSACDLLLFPYWAAAGHYSGALRTKEALACGVPITSPRFVAREEELGKDYELFYPIGGKNHFRKDVTKGLLDIISLMIENDGLRKSIGQRLYQRSKYYGIKVSGERIERDFEKVIKS